jgi:hypothetical protein
VPYATSYQVYRDGASIGTLAGLSLGTGVSVFNYMGSWDFKVVARTGTWSSPASATFTISVTFGFPSC